MRRKVSTPKFVLDTFNINIIAVIVLIIMFSIGYFGFIEKDNAVYKDNNVKIYVDEDNLRVDNRNKFNIIITVLNGVNSTEVEIKGKSDDTLRMFKGLNNIFIYSDNFEDSTSINIE